MTDPKPIKYPVSKTGFYCVTTYPFTDMEYEGVVTFRNAYGELPATQVPKLAFYGGLTILYALMGVYVFLAITKFTFASCFNTSCLDSGGSSMPSTAMISVSKLCLSS